MARVSEETIKKLQAFIESLPDDARNKCALCNETLTHIVKTAEVQTGAGTSTVTKALADEINRGAAPADKISSNALKEKVRYNEGLKHKNEDDSLYSGGLFDQNDQINNPDDNPSCISKSDNIVPVKPKRIDRMKYHRSNLKASDEFNKAFDIFMSAIRDAKNKNWQETSKDIALQYVEIIMNFINKEE